MYLCTGGVVTHSDQPLQEEDAKRVLKDFTTAIRSKRVIELPSDICNFNQTAYKSY